MVTMQKVVEKFVLDFGNFCMLLGLLLLPEVIRCQLVLARGEARRFAELSDLPLLVMGQVHRITPFLEPLNRA